MMERVYVNISNGMIEDWQTMERNLDCSINMENQTKKENGSTPTSLSGKEHIQDEKDKWLEENDGVDLREEPTLEDLFGHLSLLSGINEQEKETLI